MLERIGEKILSSGDKFDDEVQAQINPTSQEGQSVTTAEKAKDALSQEDKIALENALKKGELSNIHDILSLLGYSNSIQS